MQWPPLLLPLKSMSCLHPCYNHWRGRLFVIGTHVSSLTTDDANYVFAGECIYSKTYLSSTTHLRMWGSLRLDPTRGILWLSTKDWYGFQIKFCDFTLQIGPIGDTPTSDWKVNKVKTLPVEADNSQGLSKHMDSFGLQNFGHSIILVSRSQVAGYTSLHDNTRQVSIVSKLRKPWKTK